MSKQTAGEPKRLSAELEAGEQVQDNVIVIAGIEGDLACAAGCSDSAQNVLGKWASRSKGAIFDPDYTLDLGERAPKSKRKRLAADNRLKE